LLHELNDAVDAKFIEELPEALLESNPAFFSQFTLVIATQEHYAIESKPDNKVEDLWLYNPWPELQRFVAPPILHIRFEGVGLTTCCYVLET
jgi:amyloid beta precursor protein binding protein 1